MILLPLFYRKKRPFCLGICHAGPHGSDARVHKTSPPERGGWRFRLRSTRIGGLRLQMG